MAIVGVVFILAAALTWGKWPDLIVDYGTQLYMPWRISNGAVLYRDLFYIGGGPLSQYFNALLFKIFGISLLTLVSANLVLVAATIVLVYRRFLAATNALTATAVCLGIVLVFTFNEYMPIGNYNYITPYSHEALHGLLLSILTIALLSDWLAKNRLRYAAAAGFCTGLVFLTKPDIFFALAVCIAAGFILFAVTRRQVSILTKSLAVFFAAGSLPLLFFFFLFLRVEDWQESLRAVCMAWWPLMQPGVVNNPFYEWCLGLDQPGMRLGQIGIQSAAIVFIIALYAVGLKRVANLKSQRSPLVIYLLMVSPLVLGAACFDWSKCGAALPLMSLATGILIWCNYKKLTTRQEPIFPLLWAVFSVTLLSKMGLFPRIWHYGFVLAMPAFVSAIYLLFWLLPELLEDKFAVPRRSFCIIMCVPLFIGFANLFYQSQLIYAEKNLPVGTGNDKIIAYGAPNPTGTDISAALAWTTKNMPPNATMAVLPEGVMLNFLSHHPNPTPCLTWEPVIMNALGPSNMTTAFERDPPDYILLVERDTSEFGMGYFGSPGFGADVMQWIRGQYQPVQLIGDEPLKDGKFGIEILEHKPAGAKQN